jgi:diketogulonate reductase-like aldo/keto reductase
MPHVVVNPGEGMISKSPTIALNNGVELPAVGLGVFQSAPAETKRAVVSAIAAAYPMIDTAAAYFNEREVGQGIRESGVGRADIFVQTKLWVSDYGYESALRAFEVSLRKLGLEYVDLYMLHWPMPAEFRETVASYRALERLLADGRVRAIGVSNFTPELLTRLLGEVGVVPAVNQVEANPTFSQRELRKLHAQHGIATQAWSPLGGVNVYASDADPRRNPLRSDVVARIASRHRKTAAQVVLRWGIEHGMSVIPKSVRPERIAENRNVFDFSLTPEEVGEIDGLDTGVRGGPEPTAVERNTFGLSIPD